MKKALQSTVLILLLLGAPKAKATEKSEGQIIPKRIAVMPMRTIPTNPEAIFDAAPMKADKTISRQIALNLSKEPELTSFSWSEIKHRLKSTKAFSDALSLTKETLELGIDQYRNLRVKDAVRTLERARKLLHKKLIDFYDPKMAADLYLQMGICLVELEKLDEARLAFARMFFYEPTRRFERGFYTRRVEETLGSAITDLNAVIPIGAPGMETNFLRNLKTRGQLDQLVTLVARGNTNTEVELRIYDLNRTIATHSQKISRRAEGRLDEEQLGRFISRYIACEVFDRVTQSAYQKRYRSGFIETHVGYHTYARTPTRDIFHSLSVGIRAAKGVARNVAFYGDLAILSSFQDRHRDLANRLVSLRAITGVEYRTNWRRFTFFFSPGVEANLVPTFTVYTYANCKFFGAEHPLCNPNNIKEMKSELLFGLHAGVGLRYHPTRNVFFSLRISGGVYLLPVDENKKLDFPITAMTGLGFEL